MADTKITDLTELSTGTSSDLLAIVDDPSGSPITKKITTSNLFAIGTGALLHDETLGASGRFDVSSISQNYQHLKLILLLRSDVAATSDFVNMFFNNDTTATNYFRGFLYQVGAVDGAGEGDEAYISSCTAANSQASDFAFIEIFIPFYTSTSHNKQSRGIEVARRDSTTSVLEIATHNWESTAAINRITIQPDGYATDEFIANSRLQIIGLNYL